MPLVKNNEKPYFPEQYSDVYQFGSNMKFELNPHTSLDKNVRSLALAQIDLALSCVRAGTPADIHKARKAFKRFRALMHFIKPVIRNAEYVMLNGGVRDVARMLGAARDRQVMLETADKLEALSESSSAARAIRALRRLLQEGKAGEVSLSSAVQAEALQRLTGLRERVANLCLRGESFGDAAGSIGDTYRDGASGLKAAYKAPTDEAFHDWRKDVQRHWRHLQLVTPVWPGMIKQHVALARTLSETLGDDHDLAVLRAFIDANRGQLGPRGDQLSLRSVCTRRQSELRATARHLGRRLFAEKPKALTKRLTVYWETAKHAVNPQNVAIKASKSGQILPFHAVSTSG